MTPCRTFEERLPAYLEGLVSTAEQQKIDHHLATCDHCRSVLQDLKKTGELLAGLEEKEPPPWFTPQVMARVRAEAEKKKGWLRTLFYPLHIKIPIEALASLIIAFLAWQVYQASPPGMKALPESPKSAPVLPGEPIPQAVDTPQPAATSPALEKKTAVRDLRDPGTDNRFEFRKDGAGEEKTKEALNLAARSIGSLTAEEKKAESTDRPETAGPSSRPLKKSMPAEAKPAPAPIIQSAPREIEQGQKEIDQPGKQKLDAARDRVQVGGKGSKEWRPLVFIIRVKELGPAAEAVLQSLTQAKAENIWEETPAGRKIFSAVVEVQEVTDLFQRLKAIGEIASEGYPPSAAEGPVPIRIEIVPTVP